MFRIITAVRVSSPLRSFSISTSSPALFFFSIPQHLPPTLPGCFSSFSFFSAPPLVCPAAMNGAADAVITLPLARVGWASQSCRSVDTTDSERVQLAAGACGLASEEDEGEASGGLSEEMKEASTVALKASRWLRGGMYERGGNGAGWASDAEAAGCA